MRKSCEPGASPSAPRPRRCSGAGLACLGSRRPRRCRYMALTSEELRFVTYLSPGIPQEFFEAIVDHVRRTLGRERVSLWAETRVSGPERGMQDPFSTGDYDV